jgi:hypothetical protein
MLFSNKKHSSFWAFCPISLQQARLPYEQQQRLHATLHLGSVNTTGPLLVMNGTPLYIGVPSSLAFKSGNMLMQPLVY